MADDWKLNHNSVTGTVADLISGLINELRDKGVLTQDERQNIVRGTLARAEQAGSTPEELKERSRVLVTMFPDIVT